MVDLTSLRSARPEALQSEARTWQALSAQLDTRISGMKSDVITPLREDWSGRAATAALASLNGRTEDLVAVREYADTMAAVLRDAATGVADAQACLRAAENLAAHDRLTIGADGSVAAQAAPPALADAAEPPAEALLHAPPPGAAEASDLVHRALSIATETDTQVTARLKAIGHFEGASTANQAAAQAQLASAAKLAGTLDASAIPPRGTDPAETSAWWKSLPAADRKRLTDEFPSRIGWLDGLPSPARSTANLMSMAREKESATTQLRLLEKQDPGSPAVSGLRKELAQISALENSMAATEKTTGQQTYLLGFDTNGHGHAIVAIGDPDTATNTVTNVPGLGASILPGKLTGAFSGVQTDMRHTTAVWQQATHDAAPGQHVSSIHWLGYNAPEWDNPGTLAQVAQTGDATAGASSLARFQAGLGVAHQPGVPAHTTVIGHSYGSLVVGEAAARHHLHPTDMVFVGSPGVGVDHAAQLGGISPEHVWAGANKSDPVSYTQWFGNDPSRGPFGAQGFNANIDPDHSYYPGDVNAHESYWDPSSSSLQNLGRIVNQQYGAVSRA